MIKYIKDILVYQSSKKLDLYSDEEIKKIEILANKVDKERLMNLIYQLSEIDNNIKWSTQRTIMFQAGIIKLCCNQTDNSNSGLEKRVEKLENAIKSGNIINNTNINNYNIPQNTSPKMVSNVANNQNQTAPKKSTTTSSGPKNYSSNINESWPQIVNDLKQNGRIVLYTNLINTKAKEINDMTVGIEFPNGLTSFGRTVLQKQENIKEISDLVSIACGKEMHIKYLEGTTQEVQLTNEQNIQQLANESDIPFQVIE